MRSISSYILLATSILIGALGIAFAVNQWSPRSQGTNPTTLPTAESNSPHKPSSSLATTPITPGKGKALAPAGLFAPPRGDVRLVVISDLNSQYGSTTYTPEVTTAITLIPGWQPDLVLSGGDMVAGQSRSLNRAQIQAMWAAFDRNIAAPLRQANLPLGFTVGNHDGSAALSSVGDYLFAQDRQLAEAYWNQKNPSLPFIDRGKFPFYYTFAQNDIFYLVWDASTAKLTSEQLAWVEQSLSSPQAQAAKLRIMIGHLPLYGIAVGRNKPGEYLHNAEDLRSLMERYRVHTYISGHQHAYYPGRRGQLQLLHAGALGGGPRKLVGSDRTPQKTITVVDIDIDEKTTTYTTYDIKTLQVFDYRQLPQQIKGHNGTVFRRDIVPSRQP